MSGCWFGRTRPYSTPTRRSFLLHLVHAQHPKTVCAQWAGPKPHPFPPWTPCWIKIGVPRGRGLRRSFRLTRRPGLGPPLFHTLDRHFLCRHLCRHPTTHSRNHLQTRWWQCSGHWCLPFSRNWKPCAVTCRVRCQLWWRKPWRHIYHRYLTSSRLNFSCIFSLFVCCLYAPPTIVILFIPFHVYSKLLLYLFVSHLRQTTPEPPAPVLPMAPPPLGPSSPLVPLDEPQPGPSGLHRPVVLVRVHVDISVFHILLYLFLSTLDGYNPSTYMCHLLYIVSYTQLLCSVVCYCTSHFPVVLPTFHRRPGRMWKMWRSRQLPREGSRLPLHPTSRPTNGPDWTVPHHWQALWIRLGYAFSRVIPCQLSSCTSIHSFTIEYN